MSESDLQLWAFIYGLFKFKIALSPIYVMIMRRAIPEEVGELGPLLCESHLWGGDFWNALRGHR